MQPGQVRAVGDVALALERALLLLADGEKDALASLVDDDSVLSARGSAGPLSNEALAELVEVFDNGRGALRARAHTTVVTADVVVVDLELEGSMRAISWSVVAVQSSDRWVIRHVHAGVEDRPGARRRGLGWGS